VVISNGKKKTDQVSTTGIWGKSKEKPPWRPEGGVKRLGEKKSEYMTERSPNDLTAGKTEEKAKTKSRSAKRNWGGMEERDQNETK